MIQTSDRSRLPSTGLVALAAAGFSYSFAEDTQLQLRDNKPASLIDRLALGASSSPQSSKAAQNGQTGLDLELSFETNNYKVGYAPEYINAAGKKGAILFVKKDTGEYGCLDNSGKVFEGLKSVVEQGLTELRTRWPEFSAKA